MANILWVLSKLDLRNLIDILLVAAVIYGVLLLVRGTQAVQLLRGVILIALVVAIVGSIAVNPAYLPNTSSTRSLSCEPADVLRLFVIWMVRVTQVLKPMQ